MVQRQPDDGTITRTDQGWDVGFDRELDHPAERVWTALTDPDERAAWFFAGRLDVSAGGTVDLADPAQGVTGEVLTVDVPRLLEFTWSSRDAPHSTVRFALADREGGCRLRLTHRLDPSANPAGLLAAWHYLFENLPTHLAGQPVAEEPGRFVELRARYADVVAEASA